MHKRSFPPPLSSLSVYGKEENPQVESRSFDHTMLRLLHYLYSTEMPTPPGVLMSNYIPSFAAGFSPALSNNVGGLIPKCSTPITTRSVHARTWESLRFNISVAWHRWPTMLSSDCCHRQPGMFTLIGAFVQLRSATLRPSNESEPWQSSRPIWNLICVYAACSVQHSGVKPEY